MDRQKWWIVEFLCYNLSWASILGFFSTIRSDNIESRKLERGGRSYLFFFSNSFRSINFSKRSKRKVLKRKVKKKGEAYLSMSCHCLRGRICSPVDSGVVRSRVSIFPRCWTALSRADWHRVAYAYIRSNKIYCSVNCTRERMGKQNETKRYTCRPTKCTESRIARSHVANAPRNPRKREFHVSICGLPEAASP